MNDLLPLLNSLLSASGPSGHEGPVLERVEQAWAGLLDRTERSRLGSLHGFRRGAGRAGGPSLMIATHMDSVGLLVSSIGRGILHIQPIGDLDPRVLPGLPVMVHASNGGDLPGVIGMLPEESRSPQRAGKAAAMEDLVVDTGLEAREVSRRVKVGDLVSIDQNPIELSSGTLSGHALDNRASIAALTLTLRELRKRRIDWDLWAAATVQEEVSFAGAYTSTHQIRPSIAVAVDVTYGQGPAPSDSSMFTLGGGVTLGVGPSIHPALNRRFHEAAERIGAPVKDEPMPAASLTDVDAMQVSAEGVPTMVVGIPLRYMHTPVEVAALADIRTAGHLLAEFAASLGPDDLERIVWD